MEELPLELIGDDAEGVGYLPKQRVADAVSFVESVRRVAAGRSASVAAMVRARESYPRARSTAPRLSRCGSSADE